MSERDEAFTAYVAASRRHLVRTAYLLCGSWEQAEDATQIALAKLYVAWPRVQRHRGPDAYVRKILARTTVDEWRRPWRREIAIGENLIDLSASTPAEDGIERRGLLDALGRLPPRQRQVVVLRHYWGLSVAEVAADLGISAGSVKSHCSRAVDRLAELLTTAEKV